VKRLRSRRDDYIKTDLEEMVCKRVSNLLRTFGLFEFEEGPIPHT
jgi:hypothetical protein